MKEILTLDKGRKYKNSKELYHILFVPLSESEYDTFIKLYNKIRSITDDNAVTFKRELGISVVHVLLYGSVNIPESEMKSVIPHVKIPNTDNCLSLFDKNKAIAKGEFKNSYKCFKPYRKYTGEKYKDRNGLDIALEEMYKLANWSTTAPGVIPHESPIGSWKEVLEETGNPKYFVTFRVKEGSILNCLPLNFTYATI